MKYSLAITRNMTLIEAFLSKGELDAGEVVARLVNERYNVRGVASYKVVGPAKMAGEVSRLLINQNPGLRWRFNVTMVYLTRIGKRFGQMKWKNLGYVRHVTSKEFAHGEY